jgi:hypothetical protein
MRVMGGLQEGVQAVQGGLDGVFAGSAGAHEFASVGEGGLALLAGEVLSFAFDGVEEGVICEVFGRHVCRSFLVLVRAGSAKQKRRGVIEEGGYYE